MSRNSLSGFSTINSPVVYGNVNLVDGAINNNFCCQLVSSAAQSIATGSIYTKLNTLVPSATWGFENGLSGVTNKDMYVGSNQITLVKAGKYLVQLKGYAEIGSTSCTMILGRNGATFDTAFDVNPEGYPFYLHFILTCSVGDTISAYAAVVDAPSDVGGASGSRIITLYAGLLT